MARYGQPRRLNVVTASMLLAALGAGYWMWRFFPAYWDGWTVDHLLREAASSTYKLVRLREPLRSKELKALVDKTRADIIQQANVSDPDLAVNLDLQDDQVVVSADYSVVVTHPLVDKTTTLRFHKLASESVKKVNWE